MPSDRTTVTELGTGLGMLGLADVDEAVRSRTPVMHSLSPEMWERLAGLRAGGAYDAEFHAAWANGQAFLAAADGLRGRLPNVVEWKGTGRAPGDEVAPIDLRVDHVYLVSCKYLSNILFNVSPSHVFDDLLAGGPGRAGRAARDALPAAGTGTPRWPGGVPGALRAPCALRRAGRRAWSRRPDRPPRRDRAAARRGPVPGRGRRSPGWARATASPTTGPRRGRGAGRPAAAHPPSCGTCPRAPST